MNRSSIRCAAGFMIALAVLTAAVPFDAIAQRLAVVSRSADNVAFIDLETGSMIGLATTGNFPHEIAADSARRFAYVPAYGGESVAKIDLNLQQTVAHFPLNGHEEVHSAVWHRGTVWVTAEESGVLLGLDPDSGRIVRTMETRGYRSHMVAGSTLVDRMYVANIDSGTVSVVHPTGGLQTVLPTGAGAEGIDVLPGGSEVWVSNREDATISVIRTDSDTVVRTFNSGGAFPVKLRFRPDGEQAWVSNNRSGAVAVFDTRTYELIHVIDIGERPLGIAFSDDSRTAWITRPGADEIVEVATSGEFRIVRRLSAPPTPDGLLYLPD